METMIPPQVGMRLQTKKRGQRSPNKKEAKEAHQKIKKVKKEKIKMVSALQEALSSKETNGRSLSDEEYIMLLSKATKKGMEEAGTLKSIVENTKMKTTKGLPRQ